MISRQPRGTLNEEFVRERRKDAFRGGGQKDNWQKAQAAFGSIEKVADRLPDSYDARFLAE